MQTLDILSNIANLLGLLCLFSNRPFVDLFWYWKGKLDVFGHKNYYIGSRGWIDAWELKYAIPTGAALILLGNIGLLIVSIFS